MHSNSPSGEARRVAAPRFLERPGGRLAYEIRGQGPLVVCSPGLGDVRCSYATALPLLEEALVRIDRFLRSL